MVKKRQGSMKSKEIALQMINRLETAAELLPTKRKALLQQAFEMRIKWGLSKKTTRVDILSEWEREARTPAVRPLYRNKGLLDKHAKINVDELDTTAKFLRGLK
jgi:hypothetical protein